MAKTKKAKDTNELETTDTNAQDGSAAPRAKKGSTLSAQIKLMFMALVSGLIDDTLTNETLEAAKTLFQSIPTGATAGVSPEIQIKNIDARVQAIFESGNTPETQDELRKLLVRKARVEKAMKSGEAVPA